MTEVEHTNPEEVPQDEGGDAPVTAADAAEAGGEADANGNGNNKRKFEDEPAEEAAEVEGEPMRKRASFNGPDGDNGQDEAGEGDDQPNKVAGEEGGEPAAAPPAAAPASADPPVSAADQIIVETETVPGNLVGRLIGRGGETIKSIQDRSGASVQVDHSGPEEAKTVTIRGTRESVSRARAEIKTCLSPDTQETVECPQGIVGRIIGRQGETIKALQVASEAHIVVDQNFPDGVDRKIHVSGRPDSVERACRMIRELIRGEPGGAQSIIQKYGVGVTEICECPRSMVGRVIGKGGETIKALQRHHGVNIQVRPQHGTPVRPPALSTCSYL